MNIDPAFDYVYGKEVQVETGVVTTSDISDTNQTYEVLAVGPGRYDHGLLVEPPCKVGDVVVVMKHAAEGDTPPKMLSDGYALFMGSRIMGTVKE